MFHSYKGLLSLLLFFLVALPTFAQKTWVSGYVITPANDTIQGQIANNWDSNPQKGIIFKTGSESEKEYTPNDIISFGFNNGYDVFISIECEIEEKTKEKYQTAVDGAIKKQKATVFAKRLIKSDISLYEYTDGNRSYYFMQQNGKEVEYLIQETYYVTNRNNAKFLFQNNEYQKQLQTTFASSPTQSAKAAKVTYRSTSLLNIFEQYAKETKQKYQSNIMPNKLRFGIMVGAAVNNIDFLGPSSHEIYLKDFGAKTTPTIGLTFKKYFNKYRKQGSITGMLFLTSFRHNETLVSPNVTTGVYQQIWDFDLDIRHLNLKFMYRYDFKSSGVRPFLSAGLLYGATMHKYQGSKYTYGSTVIRNSFNIKAKTGVSIGTGICFKNVEIALNYELIDYGLEYITVLARGSATLLGLTYWFN